MTHLCCDVKRVFGGRPRVYNDFLEIMKKIKNKEVNTPGVVASVSKLFLENNYLLSGFKKFLPNGYKISMGDLRQADQAYAREDEMKVKRGKAVALRAVVSNGFNKVVIQRKDPNAVYTPRLFSRHMTESTKLLITTNCIVEKRDKQSGIGEGGGAKRRKVSSPQPNATKKQMPRTQNQQTLEYIDLFDDDNDVPEHSTVQISPKPKAAGFSDSDATIASPPNDILMTPRFTTTNHTAIKRSDTSSTSSIIDDKRIHVVVGGSIISLLPLNHICQEE